MLIPPKRGLTLVVLTLLQISAVSADVWQRTSDGQLTLHRSLDHFQRARMAVHWRPPSLEKQRAQRKAIAAIVERASTEYGISADLILAIIEVESAYDTHAVSKAGAQGLMQLMPKTALRFRVADPLDSDQNIAAGAQYLQALQLEFHEIELVLAAYNAGEHVVRHYGRKIPPYAETRAYVDQVLAVINRAEAE